MRTNHFQGATLVAAISFLASSVAAQSITVPSSVAAGGSVTVSVSYPAMAGQTVTVRIDGGPGTTPETIKITLGSDGSGTGSWTANAQWDFALFNVPGCPEASTLINPKSNG